MAKFSTSGIDDVIEDITNSMETIDVDCPVCGKSFDVDLDAIGTTVTCPHCHARVDITSE